MAESDMTALAACACGGRGRALSAEEIIDSFGDLPVISRAWVHLANYGLDGQPPIAACGCPLTQWALAHGATVHEIVIGPGVPLRGRGICIEFIRAFTYAFDRGFAAVNLLAPVTVPHARAGAEAAVAVRAYLSEHGIDPERDGRHSGAGNELAGAAPSPAAGGAD